MHLLGFVLIVLADVAYQFSIQILHRFLWLLTLSQIMWISLRLSWLAITSVRKATNCSLVLARHRLAQHLAGGGIVRRELAERAVALGLEAEPVMRLKALDRAQQPELQRLRLAMRSKLLVYRRDSILPETAAFVHPTGRRLSASSRASPEASVGQ